MRKKHTANVSIEVRAYEALLLDVYKRLQIEACGLLLGTMDNDGNWHVDDIHPMSNIFDSPVYFEFAPEELLSADLAYPNRVIGAYHSHPTGLAIASRTDHQNMKRVNVEEQIPWAWLIVSGPFDHAPSLFQQVQRRLQRIPDTSMVAYHYYEDEGLQRLAINFEGQTNIKPDIS
jgi:[CysO sulfur-carrier protein]-S-L-cysteine hydrolase